MKTKTKTAAAAAPPKLKTWKIDAGNSVTGPCGFVVYDIKAATAEDALAKVRDTFALPEGIEGGGEDDDGNKTKVLVYFNAAALTLDNVEEDEDDEDEDDEDDAPIDPNAPSPDLAAVLDLLYGDKPTEDE